jgi:hypothetical protein
VKPEQASKVAMRKPTRLCNGEGRAERGSEPVHAPDLFRRGSGHSTLARQCGLSGEARTGGVCHPERHNRWRLDRASDRFVVPLRPGNSGRGKGPDFRHALKEGEDKKMVIGDEP